MTPQQPTGPLSRHGISVMVLAIANRQNLADQDVPPRPCSEPHPDRPGLYCVAPVGHDDDHLYDEFGGPGWLGSSLR